ncbi:MAG: hypothetical protein R3D60_09465 [Paracoccaceae bacterium]
MTLVGLRVQRDRRATEANIALVLNNARLAARIARALVETPRHPH